jgi:hypothetical protein
MNIRRKVIREALEELREVKRVSTLKTAGFSCSIKEIIRLWAQIWIEAPVERVIDNLEAELKRIEV